MWGGITRKCLKWSLFKKSSEFENLPIKKTKFGACKGV